MVVMETHDEKDNEQPLLAGSNAEKDKGPQGECYADLNGVLTVGSVVVVFGMLLTLPVMLSMSKNNTIIEDVSWVYSKKANMDLYAGIQRVVIYLPAAEAYGLDYGSIECTPEFCDSCLAASGWVMILLVVAYSTWASDLFAIYLRHKDDSSFSAFFACCSSLVGIASSIGALSIFVGVCEDDLPNGENKYLDTHESNLKYGPAFILSIIGFVFAKLLLFFGHMAFAVADIPVEDAELPNDYGIDGDAQAKDQSTPQTHKMYIGDDCGDFRS